MGVIGPNHFSFSLRIDWSDRKKILNEKRKVPLIKSLPIHFLSSKGSTDKSNKARPWYIMYLIPTSKDCNADSERNFFNKWLAKAPKITDNNEKIAP